MPKPSNISTSDALTRISEQLRTQATRPNIYGYKPHAKQVQFHSSSAKARLYIGGNRSGKTTGGIAEDIMWLTGKHPYFQTPPPPVRGRIVSVDFLNGIEKIIKPELARWLPPSELLGGSWSTAYNKELRTLTLENGSFVEFMCVDEQTEVLTRRGWKHRTEIQHGDDMLTLNTNTGKTEWKHIDSVYVNPNYVGKMAKFNAFSASGIKMTIDAMVTPNHKWVTHRGIKRTDNLLVTDKITLVADCDEDPNPTWSDEYVALSGWIGGDGTVFSDGARIYQSHNNADKQAIIEQVIKRGGWRYITWENEEYKMWKVYGTFQKRLDPTLLTAYQRKIYLEALLLSDGTIEPTGKWQFTNTDVEMIDLVMMLGTMCGYRVSSSERQLSEWGVKQPYCVMGRAKESNGRNPNTLKVENAKITYVDYEGLVWCPGSPNLTFVARRNGTVYITGNSYDQDLDKFAGTSRHFIHFDEEPPQDIWLENKTRLIDTGGSYWITMTPVEGMTWIYDDIYMVGKNDPSSGITVVEVDMTENPYLHQGEVDEFISGLSADDREARVRGKFVQVGGLIYKHFDPQLHVIDPIDIRQFPHYDLNATLDHGFSNPTAWLWALLGPDGRVIVFNEHYVSGEIVAYHAAAVHAKNAELGREPSIYIGDPSIRNTDPITGTSVHLEYVERGIPIVLGNNDVAAGINKVATYLETKGEGDLPQLLITRNCVNLIAEMQRYRWATFASKRIAFQNNKKEVAHKKDDHACDALRYLIMSRPDLRPVRDSAPDKEKNPLHYPQGSEPDRTLMVKDVLAARQAQSSEWSYETSSDELMGGIW